MKPVAISIAFVQITGAYPSVNKRALCLFGFFPVIHRGAVTLDPQITFANYFLSGFIQEPCFITIEYLAATSVAIVFKMIRHEHMKQLSRSDSIENRHTKLLLPFFAQM